VFLVCDVCGCVGSRFFCGNFGILRDFREIWYFCGDFDSILVDLVCFCSILVVFGVFFLGLPRFGVGIIQISVV